MEKESDKLIQETADKIAPKLVADDVESELTMRQARLIMQYKKQLELAEKYPELEKANTNWKDGIDPFCLDQTIAWDYKFEKKEK